MLLLPGGPKASFPHPVTQHLKINNSCKGALLTPMEFNVPSSKVVCLGIGWAHWIDMRSGSQVYWLLQSQHGDIVLQIGAVEERVDLDADHVHFDVLQRFHVRFGVPFSQAYFQSGTGPKYERHRSNVCTVTTFPGSNYPKLATLCAAVITWRGVTSTPPPT